MSDSGVLLDYRGPIDFEVIDSILARLKKTKEFTSLSKVTSKRLYSLVVECLENICKHAELSLSEKDPRFHCHLLIMNSDRKLIVRSGNPVTQYEKTEIINRLDHINMVDEPTLQAMYEAKIKSDLAVDDKCAGLGFIYMALKSGNKIKYHFNPLIDNYSFFEIEITLNKYIMRKLIIDPKSNSPKVLLDPDNKIYMIEGESRPPDVREFYGQVLTWLDEFSIHLTKSAENGEPVIFDFNFEYFNSSSGKLILDICKHLGNMRTQGKNIIVNWHFEKDDFDMLEAGKEISKIVKFPFEYVVTEKS
jgi:hypothetical protein